MRPSVSRAVDDGICRVLGCRASCATRFGSPGSRASEAPWVGREKVWALSCPQGWGSVGSSTGPWQEGLLFPNPPKQHVARGGRAALRLADGVCLPMALLTQGRRDGRVTAGPTVTPPLPRPAGAFWTEEKSKNFPFHFLSAVTLSFFEKLKGNFAYTVIWPERLPFRSS